MDNGGLVNGENLPAYHLYVDAQQLVGLLAEPIRRRVVAALVLGAQSISDLVSRTGDPGPSVIKALDRLSRDGLVLVDGAAVHLVESAFTEVARQKQSPSPGIDGTVADGDPEAAAVLRAFFKDGRLTSIPMVRKKRLVVLDVLAERFEPGQLYSEARVNLILGMVHPDTAALRRAMVDEDFLGRRDGFYWRTGGTFDPTTT